MKKICAALLLIAGLLSLFGCGEEPEAQTVPKDTGAPAVTTVEATVPADGNPADVTCKGSYTGQGNGTAVVARIGDAELTNGVLSAYYWAEAAAYRAAQCVKLEKYRRGVTDPAQAARLDALIRTLKEERN